LLNRLLQSHAVYRSFFLANFAKVQKQTPKKNGR